MLLAVPTTAWQKKGTKCSFSSPLKLKVLAKVIFASSNFPSACSLARSSLAELVFVISSPARLTEKRQLSSLICVRRRRTHTNSVTLQYPIRHFHEIWGIQNAEEEVGEKLWTGLKCLSSVSPDSLYFEYLRPHNVFCHILGFVISCYIPEHNFTFTKVCDVSWVLSFLLGPGPLCDNWPMTSTRSFRSPAYNGFPDFTFVRFDSWLASKDRLTFGLFSWK